MSFLSDPVQGKAAIPDKCFYSADQNFSSCELSQSLDWGVGREVAGLGAFIGPSGHLPWPHSATELHQDKAQILGTKLSDPMYFSIVTEERGVFMNPLKSPNRMHRRWVCGLAPL